MAQQLKLVRKNDFVADVDTLDLLAFASGITLMRGGYIPSFDGGSEVITLTVKGTSRDNLAANLQGLETKLQQITDFVNSAVEPYYVVLRDQAPGETSAREAVVTGASVKLSDSLHQANLFVQNYRLALDRVGPAWEDSSSIAKTWSALAFYGASSGSNTLGGVRPGRIGRLTIKGISGKGTINELWAGFRTARFCTLANFVAMWEAENGNLYEGSYATPALASDATATPGSGNSKVAVTFISNALQMVLTLSAYQISNSYYADLRGTFDVIGRCKVGAGTIVSARLDSGLFDANLNFTTAQIGDFVSVDSTTWKYYNLGRITWPAAGRVSSNLALMKASALSLWVERTAGTSTFDVDHFVAIPVEEGYAHLSGMSVAYATNDTNQRAEAYLDALGNVVGVQYVSGDAAKLVDTRGTRLEEFTMPITAAKLVVAAQTASPALTDQVTVVLDAFKRYPTLRGAA